MKRNSEYEMSRELLEAVRFRQMNESQEKRDAIAITDEAKFGNNVLTNQKDDFRHAVNGGAKFAKGDNGAENNPLIYYPDDGNLVFSGSIPNLSNMKWQFSLNDVTASPYIFVDGLALTDEVITTLNKLRGFYKNWRDSWNSSGDLLDKLGKPNQN